jgi:DNA-binding transcriptional regulator Cro
MQKQRLLTSKPITKAEAVALYGSQTALAEALGIGKSAVSQWPDGPIKERHDLKLRYELKPEAFAKQPA